MGTESATVPPEFIQQVADAAKQDCFGPPEEPCLCTCLHCRREFMSDQMWFQATLERGNKVDGFWMCPTPNCGGAGFKFDIFPVDPDHPANEGWHYSDDGEEEYDPEFDDDETDEEIAGEKQSYDPAEPHYAAMDEEEFDDDIEGEEWKHGLQPSVELPGSSSTDETPQGPGEEEERYDKPDERPRWIDRSDEPERPPTNYDDIPF